MTGWPGFIAGMVAAVGSSAILMSMSEQAVAQAGTAQTQFVRGQAVYDGKCSGCHNADLSEGGQGPALIGGHFWSNWEGKTARQLYARIISSMPATAPGSLSPAETVDVVVFILKRNDVGMGAHDIGNAEELAAMRIAPER